ncbi:2-phosphosulfolactate phosphatase [Alkalihalobacterium elongatum]|uniref:2-phosphosulfolactate phosphatase n=1 Tax=Alkalihalobacterium elongatum TaxID=2675466 RepID=UPI001C1F968D|nr:2-phosphosulfolactate phosphatase [Alkalihalobacterium elongatum]
MKRRVTVLTRKEEIAEDRLTDCVVVVIDVLLATTTICKLLNHRPNSVIPVKDQTEAHTVANQLEEDTYLLVGESGGYEIEGFLRPDPLEITKQSLSNKEVILLTTNGTVAIRKSANAKRVYTCSLINTAAVAESIMSYDKTSSIVIACAGNDGRFSLEDFLCAGYLVDELMKYSTNWSLSDSAFVAKQYYENTNVTMIKDQLASSETGQLLKELNYHEAIDFASKKSCINIAPYLKGAKFFA